MYSLGVDIGTSGIRAVILDGQHRILAQSQRTMATRDSGYTQNPDAWWHTFEQVIFQLAKELQLNKQLTLNSVSRLAIDGTSGTVLLADKAGTPCSAALMYNDARAVKQAQLIKTHAPENTAAMGATSGLAKLLWLYNNEACTATRCRYALNQSDWISGKLLARFGFSDYNNALKMGYDAQSHSWPDWVTTILDAQQIPVSILPEVFCPGHIIGTIEPSMARHFGFSPKLQICAGTTDSTAAVIASGARKPGEAITSLGSTLVMKVISEQPVFDQQSGVYSQPYGDLWLVGGSSNSGGEVLKQYFSLKELAQLTELLNTAIKQKQFSMLDLNYYPLSCPGERFPVQDANYPPRLSPRPKQDLHFFQALLEGMADIEKMAYLRLLELGAPYPKLIKSIGGGAFNAAWSYIREQKLGIPVLLADQEQAAAGSALLAQINK